MISNENINKFIDLNLKSKNLEIIQITYDVMNTRFEEIKTFVNSVISEFSDEYGWKEESDQYFLNPLDRKFRYSYLIQNKDTKKICFVSFASIYFNKLHLHFAFGDSKYRNLGLGKLSQLNLYNEALKERIEMMDAYWPKHNNGSIILFLKIGWKIEEIRKEGTQIYMLGDIKTCFNNLITILNINF
jgi:hypothetical protein